MLKEHVSNLFFSILDDSKSLSSGGGDLALVLGHDADLAEEGSEKVAKKVY